MAHEHGTPPFDDLILLAGVRYSLPRHSYIVEHTTMYLREYWHLFDVQIRMNIQSDIVQHLMDVREFDPGSVQTVDFGLWAGILDLPVQEDAHGD